MPSRADFWRAMNPAQRDEILETWAEQDLAKRHPDEFTAIKTELRAQLEEGRAKREAVERDDREYLLGAIRNLDNNQRKRLKAVIESFKQENRVKAK